MQPGCSFLRSAKKQFLSRISLVMYTESYGHGKKDRTGLVLKKTGLKSQGNSKTFKTGLWCGSDSYRLIPSSLIKERYFSISFSLM
jgi:hypothetical protein